MIPRSWFTGMLVVLAMSGPLLLAQGASAPVINPTPTATTLPVNRRPSPPTQFVRLQDDRLVVTAHENGDRVVDFSHAGFRGGEPIPTVPARLLVEPPAGDATAILNAAIESVGKLPPDASGFRGAVLLAPGHYGVAGQIRLNQPGVVLRGSGVERTVLVATGFDRRPLIRVGGVDDRVVEPPRDIADAYVPVGSTRLTLAGQHDLRPGDQVLVTRPSTDAWIATMRMDDLGGDRHGPRWTAGSRDLNWDRVVVAVEGNTIDLDAPITCSLDARFGGGTVARYRFPARVENVGVENLSCQSTFDAAHPADEDHAWLAIAMDHVRDAWVRRVDARHFVSSAVAAFGNASRVTVQDCRSLAPVGEVGGWRRRAFFIEGQQVLMQRLWSEDALHDFTVGYVAAGPNAFVECESRNSLGASGAIDSWACGALFDRVRLDGGSIELRNLSSRRAGAGWGAGNSVTWNSAAGMIECWNPPTANNYAVGTRGEFSGDGHWWATDDGSEIASLYYAQLADRLGDRAARPRFVPNLPEGSRATTPDQARELVERTRRARRTVSDLVDEISADDPIPVSTDGLRVFTGPLPRDERPPPQRLSIRNGWLVVDNRLLIGGRAGVPWWSGSMRGNRSSARPAITRFVPGREGPGMTDDLEQLVAELSRRQVAMVEQHPPLWYERRRDDHQRVRRADADVVAPFYEWPFARSGVGRAFDGLSKWDLTKPNRWYYLRLRQFAAAAARQGLVLFNQHYMQHSILEAGAHYADFPWRAANNVNDTGLPEPIAFAGDKLIYLGELFYDVTNNPKLRELHRRYIRTQLEQLADAPNVIHSTGEEFTGSLAFMQFWLDVIDEWQRETGKDVLVALSCTKDVQDAILADAKRAAVVDIIDIRYWWYQEDGSLYAPPGGQNLAPRQWLRFLKPKPSDAKQVHRAVVEYRLRYPDKPVICSIEGAAQHRWSVLVGGGSLPALPRSVEPMLLRAVVDMKPDPSGDLSVGSLSSADGHRLVLPREPGKPGFRLAANAPYRLRRVDPTDGTLGEVEPVTSDDLGNLSIRANDGRLLWLDRE